MIWKTALKLIFLTLNSIKDIELDSSVVLIRKKGGKFVMRSNKEKGR